MGILLEKLTVSQIVNNIASRNHYVHYRAHKNRPLLPVRNKMPEVLTSHPVSEIILLTLRLLMSYIYMEHPFLMFLDHTQRRTTFGMTPLDE